MIYHGVDIIEVARIRQAVTRWGERFLRRVFTAQELADCAAPGPEARIESLAARWAAKEAAAKALGIGLRGLAASGPGEERRATLDEIEVVRTPDGRPMLHLSGVAAHVAAAAGLAMLSLSLSHTQEYAVASVIGLGGGLSKTDDA